MPIDQKKIEEWKAKLANAERFQGKEPLNVAEVFAKDSIVAVAREAAVEAFPVLLAEVERLDGFLRGPPFAEGVEARAVAYRSWDDMVSMIWGMRSLLREIEWAPTMTDEALGEQHDRCPKCLAERHAGHAPDCRLDALLR